MNINFDDINKIKINNIVNYLGHVYTIYDIEDEILYLKNPDNSNLGVPLSEIRPILLTDDVMKLCKFELVDQPTMKFVNDSITQMKSPYHFYNEEYGIDMLITIIVDYEWNDNDTYIIKTLSQLDKADKKIRWLHQLQNLFKSIYHIELISIS